MHMFRNRSLWLVLAFLPACSFFSHDIKEIDSMIQAQAELSKADQQTLVIFDVDDTLTRPTDTALQFLWQPNAFSKEDTNFIVPLTMKLKEHLAKMGPEAAEIAAKKIWSNHLLKSSFIPVEPVIVGMVKQLQERGVKVIALTACRPGERGYIKALEKWRFEELKKVAIDFSASFPCDSMIFENLSNEEGYVPMFYRGILMATAAPDNSKGRVLATFLDRVGWTPKKVIFFDDGKHNVESVVNAMHDRGIQCIGYWYRATMRQQPKLKRDVVQIQFDYLINHGQVLSEDEAAAIIRKKYIAKEEM